MSEENLCDMCKGKNSNCTYCNGTGEWNRAAQAYISNHICQCIVWDRKYCPVCKLKCHHDASGKPKQTIDPGWGGTSSNIRPQWDGTSNEKLETIDA